MLSRSLAVQALLDGKRSAILNVDPQATSMLWAKRRESKAPTVVEPGSRPIEEALKRLEKAGADIVFIDTPPSVHPVVNIAINAAHSSVILSQAAPRGHRASWRHRRDHGPRSATRPPSSSTGFCPGLPPSAWPRLSLRRFRSQSPRPRSPNSSFTPMRPATAKPRRSGSRAGRPRWRSPASTNSLRARRSCDGAQAGL